MSRTRERPGSGNPERLNTAPSQVSAEESTTRTRVAVLEDLGNIIAADANRDVADLVAAGWDRYGAIDIVRQGWLAVVERGIEQVDE